MEKKTTLRKGINGTPRGAFLLATLSLIAGVGALLLVVLRLDNHQLFYAVDDTFIHLQFARTLATNGTYGLYPGVYESATSSPAWSVLLAAFVWLLPRLSTWLPFLLNLVLAIGVLWLLLKDQSLLTPRRGEYLSWLALVLLPYALFLPGLIFIGMEHTLQALLVLVILYYLDPIARGHDSPRQLLPFFAALAVAPLVRMECLGLAAGCGIAIFFFSTTTIRRLLIGGAGFMCALIPPILIGVDNLHHGQAFLGNSVTAKLLAGANNTGLVGSLKKVLAGGNLLANASQNAAAFVFTTLLVLATLVCVFSDRPKYRASAIAMSILALFQYAFGQFGQFQRYESYLLSGSAFVLLRVFGDERAPVPLPRYASPMIIFFLLFVPIAQYKTISTIPLACDDHYLQQHQVARFFATYYDDEPVAVNDLGSVSYEHRGPVLDLVGLGSHEVANRILQSKHSLEPADMERFVVQSDVKAIAIYESWFPDGVPAEWIKVGELQMSRKPAEVAAGVVSFYAPSPALAPRLSGDLAAFSSTLPPTSHIKVLQAIQNKYSQQAGS